MSGPPTIDSLSRQVHTASRVVGHKTARVDGPKLALGRGGFTDDFELRGMLVGRLLLSPHAHARIVRIDAIRARALPGVHAVLTHHDVPRVPHTTAGQNWPEPSPYDAFLLDSKVRFVGDRVAAVAAESEAAAEAALSAIAVEYEVLPAVFDPAQALTRGAPVIHDESDCSGMADAARNLSAHIEARVGDVEAGFASADLVLEETYRVSRAQQAHIEPHIAITWLDEDGRLVIRTSTQVPFHVRRIISEELRLPLGGIRVIKPRIGGGFGNKQEMLIEDVCAALTLATGRPVRLEYSRQEEFSASRSRHPQTLTLKTGVKRSGEPCANSLRVLANTGAYGTHGLTVQINTGSKTLPLYRCPNLLFECDVAYTNTPVAGAFRGYGAPQGYFALECHMDLVAEKLGLDPLEYRRAWHIRSGDPDPLAVALGEGKEGHARSVGSCELEQCIELGAKAIGWARKRPVAWRTAAQRDQGVRKRGVGVAITMQGTAIPGDDMGGAALKLNEDGSWNLLVGATDLGTGSDTALAQIAAEVLGCSAADVIVYSSDTDMTPFDVGAYASSTTFISGGAVQVAAEDARAQLLAFAAQVWGCAPTECHVEPGAVVGPQGRRETLAVLARQSIYGFGVKRQIMGVGSRVTFEAPPPFSAQFAEVEVDCETGLISPLHLVCAVDCGVAINPQMAEGQVEGGVTQALGYALCEDMPLAADGRLLVESLRDYHIFQADEMPELTTILVSSFEPSGPFGAKAVAEIPLSGVAPAIANAVYDACGVRLREIPMTAERVLAALDALDSPSR